MATETELKLAVAPADWGRLKRRLARWGAPQRTTLLARYLDTDEALLARQRMGLRLRREGERWIQTLKTEGRAGALTARGEWNSPARIVAGQPVVDALALAETPLAPVLSESFVAGLKTRFEVRMRRASWCVDFAGAQIEIALDRGQVRAAGARAPVAELELELLSGPRLALIELALQLVQGQGREQPLALLCAVESKAGRGLRLMRSARVEPSPPAAAARCWRPLAPAPVMLRELLPAWVANLAANARGLAELELSEYRHQTQAVLQRIRTARRVLAEREDFPARLDRELMWLARALRRPCDAGRLRRGVRDEGAPTRCEPAPRCDALSVRELGARHGSALESPRFAQLMLELLAWAESPAPQPSGETAGRRLVRRLELQAARLQRRLIGLESFDSCAWRRVRLRAEGLRFAIELTTPSGPWPEALDALEQAATRVVELDQARAALGQRQHEAERSEFGARVQAAREQGLAAGRRVLSLDRSELGV